MTEAERIGKYDTLLTAVMPTDFKDWHENSKNEWPEIAAHVITNLREQRDELSAENEVLRTACNRFSEDEILLKNEGVIAEQFLEIESLRERLDAAVADKADLFRIYEQRCAELDAAMVDAERYKYEENGRLRRHIKTLEAELNKQAALAQKETQQEPVAWMGYAKPETQGQVGKTVALGWYESDVWSGVPLYKSPPHNRAVLKQALEALDDTRYVSKYSQIVDAIAAIREQLGETP